jgi:glycosyltransferase involved in cell wall biosynthesis
MTRASDLAETTLSMLKGENGRQVKELNRLISWLKTVEKPDVVHLSNCLLSGLAKRIKEELNVPVISTLQDEDIFIDPLPEPSRSRIWETLSRSVCDIDGFIAVSQYFMKMMSDRLNIPEKRIKTIYNGIPLDGYEQSINDFNPPVIGFLERQCPEKGLHILVDAFIQLKKTEVFQKLKLRIAGGKTTADERYIRKIRRRLSSKGLLKDVEFLPCLNRIERVDFLKSLSVLSVPAIHPEAFGIYVLEAHAAGVPVVQPSHGAFPELLEMTGGGILCEPNDADDLAETLRSLLLNPKHAKSLGTKGRENVRRKFGIHQMGDEYLKYMEQVIASFATKTQTLENNNYK